MFVFLSDVFLDDQKVMDKLATLFVGYSDSPPTAFVFLGNFSSTPYGALRNQKLKSSFKSLADLILQFPSLAEQSHFLSFPARRTRVPGTSSPPTHPFRPHLRSDRPRSGGSVLFQPVPDPVLLAGDGSLPRGHDE